MPKAGELKNTTMGVVAKVEKLKLKIIHKGGVIVCHFKGRWARLRHMDSIDYHKHIKTSPQALKHQTKACCIIATYQFAKINRTKMTVAIITPYLKLRKRL